MSACALLMVLGIAAVEPEAPAFGDATSPRRLVLDSVAAVVERRVITLSEVKAEARLAVVERAGPEAALVDMDRRLLAAVLETIVAQELLAYEARRTGVVVREADVDQSVVSLRGRIGDGNAAKVFWARTGIDEELLRSRARRDLAAQALLGRALPTVRIPDDEVAAHLRTHPELEGPEAARSILERAGRDVLLHALLDRLRNDVDVRVMWRP